MRLSGRRARFQEANLNTRVFPVDTGTPPVPLCRTRGLAGPHRSGRVEKLSLEVLPAQRRAMMASWRAVTWRAVALETQAPCRGTEGR